MFIFVAMVLTYYVLDVFTDHPFGGNPLAVFFGAQTITTDQMQQIAKEMNLSESVFVLDPDSDKAKCKLRIFTPAMELPFAGHPTIGTACLLASIEKVDKQHYIFEQHIGPIPVSIVKKGEGKYYAELTVAKLPEWSAEPPPVDHIADALSINAEDIHFGFYKPEIISCGVPYLIVPVKSLEILAACKIHMAAWERYIKHSFAADIYVVMPEPEQRKNVARARMFGPAFGITEDPATGSAAAPLAAYLSQTNAVDGIQHFLVEQGFEMGRPSFIDLSITRKEGQIVDLKVGGLSVLVAKGDLFF